MAAGPQREREHSSRLQSGCVLEHRFVIRRLIGAGGMGEVYEAEDLRLNRALIALKTIRAEYAADEVARRRFQNEVLLARSIAHPHVCPVYEIFSTQSAEGELWFLTMKLLTGETLATRLRRAPSRREDALRFAGEIASGLDAMHNLHIVHRDLKPGNVFIETWAGGERAVLTDFGLARVWTEKPVLTATEHAVGTPLYIAPEVLAGDVATPASDIYSFGVLVHGMFFDQRPSMAETVAKGGESAEVRELRSVVGRCLCWQPQERFGSASEVVAALRAAREPPTLVAPRMEARSTNRKLLSRRAWLYGGASAALVAAATGSLFVLESSNPLPSKRLVAAMVWPSVTDPKTSALLGHLMDSVSEKLTRAEAYDPNFLLIRNTGAPGEIYVPASPTEAAGILGANLVLAASLAISDKVKVVLSVLDAANAKTLRRDSIAGNPESIDGMAERLAEKAARLLDVQLQNSAEREDDDFAGVPADAYQLYSEAEAQVRLMNDAGVDAGIDKYQNAIQIDPRFAAAYAGLALAYVRRFYLFKDRSSLQLAAGNAKSALDKQPMSRKARLAMALTQLYHGDTQTALKTFSELLRRDPGNQEVLMYEALAFRDLGRTDLEEQVYRSLIVFRPNYWPAYNDLGSLEMREGHDEQAVDFFRQAKEAAPKAALPWANLSSAYLKLGNLDGARDACERSIANFPNEMAFLNLGNIEWEARDYRKALAYYERARGINPNYHMTWRNIGDCYTMLGPLSQVVASYRKAASLLAGELQTDPNPGPDWMTLAYYSAKSGDKNAARKELQEAERRNVSDPSSQLLKAQVLLLLGEREAAIQLVQKLLAHGLSPVEVDLAIDLRSVKNDSRIREYRQKSVSKAVGSKEQSRG